MFKPKEGIKKYLLIFFSFFWLVLSFVSPYYLIVYRSTGWLSFSDSFVKYLIFFQPISTLAIAYILTGGKLSGVKNKIKPIVASTVILVVFAFTMMQWVNLTTNYGQYGAYVKSAEKSLIFFIGSEGDTGFERETIFREAFKHKYEIAFAKIFIFDSLMLASTLLLLYSMNNKEKE